MLADGDECVSDLGAVREQNALLGEVASDSTAFRMGEKIANEPRWLDALRSAHASARERFWELDRAPEAFQAREPSEPASERPLPVCAHWLTSVRWPSNVSATACGCTGKSAWLAPSMIEVLRR
jgi:hypothetical protein